MGNLFVITGHMICASLLAGQKSINFN